MYMKKSKFLFFVLGALVFSLAACNTSNDNSEGSNNPSSGHQHTYSSSWNNDDTYHWHDATCGHDVVSGKEKHTFNDVVTNPTYTSGGYTTHTCTVCGYSYTDSQTDQLVHHYESGWSHNESTHWHACTDSGYEHLKKDEESHIFNHVITEPSYATGGYTTHTCTICGYSYVDSETESLPITVIWKNYNGEVLEVDNNVRYGTMPSYDGATPTKPSDDDHSYSFSGWYPNLEIVTIDAIYTAQFSSSIRKYTIHFDANGGHGEPQDLLKDKNQSVLIPSIIPEREHYNFCGWNSYYSNDVYQPNSSFTLDEDLTLYAMWCEHCHSCEGKGTITTEHTCSKCSGKGTITTSTQTWVPCSSCNGKGKITITYTGVCSKCNGWGGDVLCECTCGYKWWANQTGSRKCSRCGRTVSGTRYTTCSNCNGSGTEKKTQTSTCTACSGSGGKYSTSTSTSTCSTCKGTGKTSSTSTCSSCHGEGLISIDSPTLQSSTYNSVTLKPISGFEYSNGGSNWQESNVFNNLKASTTYSFYQRKANDSNSPFGLTSKALKVTTSSVPTYSITYVLNGGSASNPSSYTIEDDDFNLNSPTKKGYSFVGWTGSNGDIPQINVIINHGSTGNKTFYANWEANTYTITFVTNGGEPIEPISAPCDSPISLPNCVYSGKEFVGWFTDSQLTKRANISTMPSEDMILYAKWNAICNIVLNPNGGILNESSEITITETHNYSLPTPVKNGYDFNGWYNGDTKVSSTGVWSGTTDVVLTAHWTPTKYKITYNLFGGTNNECNPPTYTIESPSIIFEDPTKEGCNFLYWTNQNGDIIDKILEGSTGDVVLNANWEAQLFNLVVTSSDESLGTAAITIGTGYAGEDITVTALPTGDHHFEGWYCGETLLSTQSVYSFSMPAHDYSLIARFSEYSQEWLISHGVVPTQSGNKITYGMYPQTKITNTSLISSLNLNASEPNEVGYQFYQNEYYEKLGSDWFLVEAIEWDIFTNSNGEYFLASSLILDVEIYDDDSNNYENSVLRNFLNETFYQKAFFMNSEYVLTTNVDNSAASTGKTTNKNACNNTMDKVFALSVKELNTYTTSTTRCLEPTEYAKARGCWVDSDNDGCYWTRSPEASRANCAYRVLNGGSIATETNTYAMVYRTDDGVRPAIRITLP